TATTSPLASVSDTPFSTSLAPKRLWMPLARIIGLVIGSFIGAASVIDGMAFLQALEEPRQHQRHQQVEARGDDEGGDREVALHDAARGAQQVVEREHVDQRGV